MLFHFILPSLDSLLEKFYVALLCSTYLIFHPFDSPCLEEYLVKPNIIYINPIPFDFRVFTQLLEPLPTIILNSGVAQNWRYLCGGPHNKDYSILAFIFGSSYLGKLPFHYEALLLPSMPVGPVASSRHAGNNLIGLRYSSHLGRLQEIQGTSLNTYHPPNNGELNGK